MKLLTNSSTLANPTSDEIAENWRKVIEAVNYHNEFMPRNWTSKNFETFSVEPGTELANMVKKLRQIAINGRYGVFLAGAAGSGKTHLLLSILANLAWSYYFTHNGIHGQLKFYNYADLCGILRQDPNDFNKFHKIRSADLLFIDDIGVSKTSDFVQEKIYSLFNYRMENELPTFATTNLTIKEVSEEFTERMTSRLKESSIWLTLKTTGDWRTKIYQENINDFKKG